MELGLHYWNFSNPSDLAEISVTLTSAAEIAEQEGLAEFSVVDHFFQMEHVAPADQPMLEAYATLAYVAARTKRIRLAALVTGVVVRARTTWARSSRRTGAGEVRDYDAIRKTAIYPKFSQVFEKTDLFLAEARQYAALSISQLDVSPDRNPVEYIKRAAQLVPVLAAL